MYQYWVVLQANPGTFSMGLLYYQVLPDTSRQSIMSARTDAAVLTSSAIRFPMPTETMQVDLPHQASSRFK
jgi:hypothetical protein